MKEIWIIGFGHFGQRAAAILSKRKDARVLAVDSNPAHVAQAKSMDVQCVEQDGVDFVAERLEREPPQWIVAALPVHLTFEWLLIRLNREFSARRIIPADTLDSLLPHPMRGQNGDIYVTHATWRCPEDCAEPGDICTVTQEKRPLDMFRVLEGVAFENYTPLVVRSRQLAPGVGGYRPEDLFSIYDRREHTIYLWIAPLKMDQTASGN